jgi:hypothetical protein
MRQLGSRPDGRAPDPAASAQLAPRSPVEPIRVVDELVEGLPRTFAARRRTVCLDGEERSHGRELADDVAASPLQLMLGYATATGSSSRSTFGFGARPTTRRSMRVPNTRAMVVQMIIWLMIE